MLKKAIDIVSHYSKNISFRGDTTYSISKYFDNWDARGIKFIFGKSSNQTLMDLVNDILTIYLKI